MLTPTGLRLFIAAEVPDAVRSEAAGLRARWEQRLPGARWTKPEGIHLTLKFLGGTEEARLPAVIGVLTACASQQSGFDLKTGGPGLFGDARRPRVLWIALDGDTSAAGAFAGRIEDAMQGLGFAREDRPFRPHLTLARFDVKRGTAIPDDLLRDAKETLSGREVPIRGLVLFQSLLGPGGSQYIPLKTVPFAEGSA